jgi:hypothetical protein
MSSAFLPTTELLRDIAKALAPPAHLPGSHSTFQAKLLHTVPRLWVCSLPERKAP